MVFLVWTDCLVHFDKTAELIYKFSDYPIYAKMPLF